MGVCSYNGGTLPAKTRGQCTASGGIWTEDAPQEDNNFYGSDFLSAIKSSVGKGDEGDEALTGYLSRRWEEDPTSLALDASMFLGGGAGLALKGTGLTLKALRAAFLKAKPLTKPKTKTMFGTKVKPVTRFGPPVPQTRKTFGVPVGNKRYSPRLLPVAAAAAGYNYLNSETGLLPDMMRTDQSFENEVTRDKESMATSKATLDKTKKEQDDAAKIVADNEATLQAEQDRVANMSFFDKWKAGMKDPTTAALFGAGLSDIGSNQPGQNSLAELQAGMAKTSGTAGAKQSKAEFDATAISEATLIKRFMTSPSMLKLRGDSDTARTAKASGMAIKYKSMRAQMFALGMPTHYEAVMEMLEKQALEIERRQQGA